MAAELYSPEWIDEQYNLLAPQVQAEIEKVFKNRGARFGAQEKRAAEALTRLRTELATQAAMAQYKRKVAQEDFDRQVAERKRQEGVSAAEQLRRENMAQTEKARERSESYLDRQEYKDWYDKQQKAKNAFEIGKQYGVWPKEYSWIEDELKRRRGESGFGPGLSEQAGIEGFGVRPGSQSGFVPYQGSYSAKANSSGSAFNPTGGNTGKPGYRYEVYTRNNLGNGDASKFSGDPESAIYVYDWDTGRNMSFKDYQKENPVTPGRGDKTDFNQDWQNKKQQDFGDNRNWFQKTGDSITEGWRNFTDTFSSWFTPENKQANLPAQIPGGNVDLLGDQPQSSGVGFGDYGNPETMDESGVDSMKKNRGFKQVNPFK